MSAKVVKAITSVMEKIGAIGKGRKNEKQGWAFRGIDDVLNALQPSLVEAGLVIIPRVKSREIAERESKAGGAMIHVVAEVEYSIRCEDEEIMAGPFLGECMDSGDKACAKAMSIAYKYMAFQVFCIPTEEQKDPDHDSPQIEGRLSKARVAYAELCSQAKALGIKPIMPSPGWTADDFAGKWTSLHREINQARDQK